MDTVQSSNNKKRSDPKDCPFRVTSELMNPSKRKYTLQIVKPDITSNISGIRCPTVSLKKEKGDNQHALYIMHNLNHENILSMKGIARSKIDTIDLLSAIAFVEPIDVILWPQFKMTRKCADSISHIPNSNLRTYLREIVTGLDFLWMRDLYHGNLSWESALHYQTTVKLAGFEGRSYIMTSFHNSRICELETLS